MSISVAVLAGPTAGGGRARAALPQVLQRLRAGGADVALLPPAAGPGAAVRQARHAVAGGAQVLVAVGGDGTVALAVQALAGQALAGHAPAGTGAALGVVPAGTGDDGARTLGLPRDVRAAVDVVLAGARRTVDLGRVGDRAFLSVLSSGFDSRVTERAEAVRWPRGRARYLGAVVAELGALRPVPYELVLDGRQHRLEALMVAVGNGPSYGGGMRVCPGADLADGLLDVTVVLPVPRATFVRLFPSVYRGTHVRSPHVRTFRAAAVGLWAPGAVAYADGERVGPLPVEIACEPAALTVLVPASAAG